MNQPGIRFILIVAFIVIGTRTGISQIAVPEILEKGNLTDQLKFIEEKTLIYENYRAIREDMFQRIKKNTVDSLTTARNTITGFIVLTGNLNLRIDSLKNDLASVREELKHMTTTKNSIHVLGFELNKTAYNSVMWTIVLVLAALLVIGFLAFKSNLYTTLNTKKELKELKEEFEAYRQKTRLEREKVSMDHFNEIRKLKGK
jgi:hypothetical protein